MACKHGQNVCFLKFSSTLRRNFLSELTGRKHGCWAMDKVQLLMPAGKMDLILKQNWPLMHNDYNALTETKASVIPMSAERNSFWLPIYRYINPLQCQPTSQCKCNNHNNRYLYTGRAHKRPIPSTVRQLLTAHVTIISCPISWTDSLRFPCQSKSPKIGWNH